MLGLFGDFYWVLPNRVTPEPPHPALRAALSPKGGEGMNSTRLPPRPFGGEGQGVRGSCHSISQTSVDSAFLKTLFGSYGATAGCSWETSLSHCFRVGADFYAGRKLRMA